MVFKKRGWEELGNCPKNPDPHNDTPNFGPNKTDGNLTPFHQHLKMGFLGWGKSEAYDYIGILKESHR